MLFRSGLLVGGAMGALVGGEIGLLVGAEVGVAVGGLFTMLAAMGAVTAAGDFVGLRVGRALEGETPAGSAISV